MKTRNSMRNVPLTLTGFAMALDVATTVNAAIPADAAILLSSAKSPPGIAGVR